MAIAGSTMQALPIVKAIAVASPMVVVRQTLCFKCFMRFKLLFQVFHLDVAKVDLDVAYVFECFRCFRLLFKVFHLDVEKVDVDVAMTKYACCKPMFQVF
jgi:hypothetical protein